MAHFNKTLVIGDNVEYKSFYLVYLRI